jgi:tetraacyldisaccharide 4'-kinase
MAERLKFATAFGFHRRIGEPSAGRGPAFAFAGIAKPERFYNDLEGSGWQLVGRRSFSDHHAYSASDLEEMNRRARSSGAQVMLTTEKDAVRLPVQSAQSLPIASVPLEVSIEPAFRAWMRERLTKLRAA